MTAFGIYLVIVYVLGALATVYYIGKGGMTSTPGTLTFSLIWSTFNVIGLFLWGTGLGLF